MKTALNLTAWMLVGALALAGCESSQPNTQSATTPPGKPEMKTSSAALVEPGAPGGVFVETHRLDAKVTALDPALRALTIEDAQGKRMSIRCGPEAINYDQIRVGDRVKVQVTEELAISMGDESTSPAAGASVVALAPRGAKPAGIVAKTVEVAAKVMAIDLKNRKAVLQFPDTSTHTVSVREDVDLTKRTVGEKVVIRVTEIYALSVEKP